MPFSSAVRSLCYSAVLYALYGPVIHLTAHARVSPRTVAHVQLRAQWARCDSNETVRAVVFNLRSRRDRWIMVRDRLSANGICAARLEACSVDNVANSTVGSGRLFWCDGQLVAGVYAWEPTNYLFNGLTQLKGWADVAKFVRDDEYMLFLEDDVAIHPMLATLPAGAVNTVIRTAFATSATGGHGIAYFGLCSPVCIPVADPPRLPSPFGAAVAHQPCTGACGHAYALSGAALRALNKQADRTVSEARGDAGTQGSGTVCELYVKCIHDPYGVHDLLRQRCSKFAGGWVDADTHRCASALNLLSHWCRKPM